jgi:hypothetical protein
MTKKRTFNLVIIIAVLAAILAIRVISAPSGPSITYAGMSNGTAATTTLEGNASIEGGDIATLLLVTREQDDNWKAYVGNVSGMLVLQDSANYSIYEWPLATPTGEVYATRTSTSVNWATVACATPANVAQEEVEMGHTVANTPTDSINKTFDDEWSDHWGFMAGDTTIGANSCNYSINPWINDTANSVDLFEEVLLYDGTNLLYTSRIQDNLFGYHNNITYDFQMLVAENASTGASRTNYYFYVELL